MCIIIENKLKKSLYSLINKEDMIKYQKHNPDGFGITIIKSKDENREIITIKGFKEKEFLEAIDYAEEDIKNTEYYIHLRLATVGEISIENAHPFDVLNNKEFYLMHNGTLPMFELIKESKEALNTKISDSKYLSNFIGELLQKNNYEINCLNLKEKTEEILGNGRAVLISKNGSVILNRNKWIDHKGLLLSKPIESILTTKLN